MVTLISLFWNKIKYYRMTRMLGCYVVSVIIISTDR